ncbi:MAG: phage Gp37/Gp68 family protein [Pseudomonadota bacterium]
MAEISNIEWCDATVNFWWGCTKVSPGCANCYADSLSRRVGKDIWGKDKPREDHRVTATKLAMKLNEIAKKGWFCECYDEEGKVFFRGATHNLQNNTSKEFVAAQKARWPDGKAPESFAAIEMRPRVFSASMSDWLDPEVPIEWLADMLDVIRQTPHLDWLLLTKRPELWRERIMAAMAYIEGHENTESGWRTVELSDPETRLGYWLNEWFDFPPSNVWIGTTVEDQKQADARIPELLKIPAGIRFLSCEPMVGPVLLPAASLPAAPKNPADLDKCRAIYNRLKTTEFDPSLPSHLRLKPMLSWVICGGESGRGARPMHPNWARALRDQCLQSGVPFFFKQWGEYRPAKDGETNGMENHVYVDDDLAGAMFRVGKRAAGRTLDGAEHSEFPINPIESDEEVTGE